MNIKNRQNSYNPQKKSHIRNQEQSFEAVIENEQDVQLGEAELELLDNISWDTDSDEERYEHDDKTLNFFRKKKDKQ